MTGAQALTMLMARLGGRTNAALRALLLLEMQQVQKVTLEGGAFLPWFLITSTETTQLTANTRAVNLPSDFLREVEEDGSVWIKDSSNDWQKMTKADDASLQDRYLDDETDSLPLYYSIVGNQLLTYPISTVASYLRIRYYATDTVLDDNAVETDWLKYASDLVIGETGLVAASLYVRDDPTKVAEFKLMRDMAFARLYKFATARAEANRSARMG